MCYDDDRCLEYLTEYMTHPKITIFKASPVDKKARGFYNLYCNQLLDRVENGWIMFLDDDDIWKPNKVASQLKVFDSNPECVLSYSSRDIVFSNNLDKVVRKVEAKFSGFAYPTILWSNLAGVTSSIAIRKETLMKTSLFDES